MEKIFIISRETESDQLLIQLLNALFPECEICAISPGNDNSRTCANNLYRLLVADTKGSSTQKCGTSVEYDHHHFMPVFRGR